MGREPLSVLFEGSNAWNDWRRENPNVIPDFTKVNLAGIHLAGANLSRANLYHADLSRADLSEADLSFAHLSEADLSLANLSAANLSSAICRSAKLGGANLADANLTDADLRGANLSGADLRMAKLHNASLVGAALYWANLTKADLSGADLSWTSLIAANLSHARLADTKFSQARLAPIRVYAKEGASDVRKAIVAAVTDLANQFGFELLDDASVDGSWYKKWFVKAKDNPDVRERLEKLERAVELAALEGPQAAADKMRAEGAAALLTAICKEDEAAIQVGTIVIVKRKDPDGQSQTVVHTLTQKEMIHLERNRFLLREPEKILRALSEGASDESA